MNSQDLTTLRNMRNYLFSNSPDLSVYLGALESVTSASTTTVVVANVIRGGPGVLSVWNAGDPTFIGTNYYTDSHAENYSTSTITLDSALPGTNTDVVVAYYSDCPDCEWDDIGKASMDSGCTTCNGLGKELDDGIEYFIPVRMLPRGQYREEGSAVGTDAKGIIRFDIQAQFEGMVLSAKKILFRGKELKSPTGMDGFGIEARHFATGDIGNVRLSAEYESI